METIKEYVKLMRLPNLLLVVSIQLLMYHCVLVPVLAQYSLEPCMPVSDFYLLVLSLFFIAAGGYVVNDYFDMKIDEINLPLSHVVGKTLTKKQTMLFYQILSGIGMALGILLCVKTMSFTNFFVYVMFLGLLWFYSSSYKRQFVLGNLIVAFLMGMVPFFLALFELRYMTLMYEPSENVNFIAHLILNWLGAFSVLAFMWTFIYEVVKDFDTEKGDRELECHTFAVVLGFEKAKILVYCCLAVALAVCSYFVFCLYPMEDSLSWRYFLCAIVVTSGYFVYSLKKATTRMDFRFSANLAKMILILSMAFSVIVYYES